MISSISPRSLQDLAAVIATSGRSAVSEADLLAARIAAAPPGTVVEDPTMGEGTIVEPSAYEVATSTFDRGPEGLARDESAGWNMVTIKKELQKLDASIAKKRPELAGSSWDFKLVDGKFKVTGADRDDARWLEQKLNSNEALRNAAQSFMETATTDLETTDANPAREFYNSSARRTLNYTFYKVGEQLEDKLSFRSLLTKADEDLDSNILTIPEGDRGRSGIAVAAWLLKASNPPIEVTGPFYTVRYDPLQR